MKHNQQHSKTLTTYTHTYVVFARIKKSGIYIIQVQLMNTNSYAQQQEDRQG